jgi:tRNA(Ile)-lysidine synthase
MKTNLLPAFKDFIKSESLKDQKTLLMVSGGVDSMVLLHVAMEVVKPENLAVFHLNHNVRDNSDSDEKFVQNICSKSNVKFYGEKLASVPTQNVESDWRQQRKKMAQVAADDFGALRILSAHHATDLVETMIFRLTKGAGPSGLAPFNTSTKPFWQIPKTDLLAYAKAHNLEWREDVTNLNTKFERNLIRHEVLPVLRKITPNLESVFVRESETFSQVQSFLNSFFLSSRWEEPEEGFLKNVLKRQSIKLFDFFELPAALQNELLRTIASKNPSQSELADCLKWLKNKPEGNSQKELGGAKLQILKNKLTWGT